MAKNSAKRAVDFLLNKISKGPNPDPLQLGLRFWSDGSGFNNLI